MILVDVVCFDYMDCWDLTFFLIDWLWQDFLNMYFKDIYKPIPLVYNLVLAMLWRHPENVELDEVKVVHYCAAVSIIVFFFIACPRPFAM